MAWYLVRHRGNFTFNKLILSRELTRKDNFVTMEKPNKFFWFFCGSFYLVMEQTYQDYEFDKL